MSGILGGIAGNLAGGNIGRAVVSLVLDSTGYNAQLEKSKVETQAATTGMSSGFDKFKGAAVAGAAVAATALAAFAANAVKAASDEQESLNKSRVVFGGASADVEAFAETSAESFGISKQAALEASASFGNMLESAGIAQDQAGQMSTAIVQLAADLASFNNVDPAEALEKLRSGLSGQARPLRAFGILLSENSVAQEAYADGIAKTGAELTEGQKVQARYNLILKQTGTAQGDFARTSDGLANQQRILRAEWEDMQAEVGEKLLPVLQEMLPTIEELARDVIPALATAVELLIPALESASQAAKGLDDILGLLQGHAPTDFFAGLGDRLDVATRLMGGLTGATGEATEGQIAQRKAEIEAATSASALAESTGDAAVAQASLAQQTRKATQAMQEQRLAQLEAAGGLLGLVSSLQQTKEDQAALNKLQAQGKTNTQAYRDAVVQATTDQLAFRTEVRQYVQDNPNRSLSATRAALREMATQAGITGQQFRDALGGPLKDIIGQLNNLQSKRVTIGVDSSQLDLAQARADRLQQALARIS